MASVDLRELSSPEVHSYYGAVLDRIEAVDPAVAAFLPEVDRRGRVLAEAKRLTDRYADTPPAAKPPLFGLPLGVKDLFNVEGFATRAGSRLPPELFAGPEASAVTRLKRAGAIVLGKTVTTEFAYFSPGPTRNPWHLDHTPGGSSSGSAAAVAAGMALVAIGTQTIGSVNRPAAFCGVVGYKPSYGRAPIDGVVSFSHSSDHVGLFAPDVATVTAAAEVLCDLEAPAPNRPGGSRGFETGDLDAVRSEWTGVPPGTHFVRCRGPYEAQADAEAQEAVDRVVEVLLARAGRGASTAVVELDLLPDIDKVNTSHQLLIAREFAEVHKTWSAAYGDLYSPKSRELVEKGRSVDEPAYRSAKHLGGRLRNRINQALGEGGVIVSPSAPGIAPSGIDTTGSPIMNLPWTYAGLPTVTLPVMVTKSGLPVAVQLVGQFGADSALLQTATAVEAAIDFRP